MWGLDELAAANVLQGDIRLLGAVSYDSAPVVSGSWDAGAAKLRLRKWASSDSSGDVDKIDLKKYARGFAFVDGDGSKLGDYKLPHHDIRGGQFVTVKRGVEAAAGAVNGARGGAQLPQGDVTAVKRHLAEHFHQWGGVAPWENRKGDAMSDTEMKGLATYGDVPEFLKKMGKSKKDGAKAMGLDDTDALDDLIDKDEEVSDGHKAALKRMKALKEKMAAEDVEGDNQTNRATAGDMPPFGESGTASDGPAARASALDLYWFAVELVVIEPYPSQARILRQALAMSAALSSVYAATGARNVDAAVREVRALSAFAQAARSATGEDHLEDVLEKVVSLSARAEEIKRDQKKQRGDRVGAMLSAAQKDGKIAPAEIDGKHGLRAIGMESPDRLEAMLTARPTNGALGTLSRTFTQPRGSAQGGGEGSGAGAGGTATLTASPFGRGEVAPDYSRDVAALSDVLGTNSDGTARRYENLSNIERHNLSTEHPNGFSALRAEWEQRGRPVVKKAS